MNMLGEKKLLIFIPFLIAYFLSLGFYHQREELNGKISLSSCNRSQDLVDKKQCWEQLIESTLQDHGLEETFNLVDFLYKNDSLFAFDCHAYVHLIGEKTYQLFSQNQSLTLSTKASYCGYGFYHGFMETLLLAGDDLKKAGQFCDWAEKQVGGKNDVKGACFHGIGHGLSDNHDKKYWSNENELVDNPLIICETVAPSEYMINRCSSGVFNVLAINYISNFLPINQGDPLDFCKRLTKSYFKKPCLEEMNTMLIAISGRDMVRAAKFLEGIENQYASSAMRSLAGVVGMNSDDNLFSLQVDKCRKVRSNLRLSCIRGFVSGLIEGAISGTQEVKALSFCRNPMLESEEEINCYQEALRLLSLYLPLEKYQRVCNQLSEKYRRYCT